MLNLCCFKRDTKFWKQYSTDMSKTTHKRKTNDEREMEVTKLPSTLNVFFNLGNSWPPNGTMRSNVFTTSCKRTRKHGDRRGSSPLSVLRTRFVFGVFLCWPA